MRVTSVTMWLSVRSSGGGADRGRDFRAGRFEVSSGLLGLRAGLPAAGGGAFGAGLAAGFGGGFTEAVAGRGGIDAGGAFGVTDGETAGRLGGTDGGLSSAAAFAISSARLSWSASDAASAARRSHLSASTRSPRANDVAAVESAQDTSSGSSSRTFGIGLVLIET